MQACWRYTLESNDSIFQAREHRSIAEPSVQTTEMPAVALRRRTRSGEQSHGWQEHRRASFT